LDNPVDVFASLPLRPDGPIKEPWPLEKEVLQRYYGEQKDHPRVAIELPTGSGKSIIGLVLLESWRRAGKRVAILTSSIALADDMVKRCADLGIESAPITGKRFSELEGIARAQNKRKYARKQAIGIMNYWAYMMAKDVPEPDVLVVDDADFFENFLISDYAVTVSRKEDEGIWNVLIDDLAKHRIYQARIEAFKFSDTTEETLVVYFTHAVELVKKLRTLVLSGREIVSEELSYSFDRNKAYLDGYLMFVTREGIVFAPYISPGLNHERLRGIEKIIFMSATIGSREYIHRILGSDTELEILTEKDVKSNVGTMGKRIIFPLDGITPSAHMEDDMLRAIVTIHEKFGKTLVMCNSFRDAYKVAKVLGDRGHQATVYTKESDSSSFSNARSGALITAGRFIGIDLPDEACRISIITRMPFVLGPADAFVKDLLGDTAYINEKVGHRLVQAFGRVQQRSKGLRGVLHARRQIGK
jgi:Rad3-related DNA helicase